VRIGDFVSQLELLKVGEEKMEKAYDQLIDIALLLKMGKDKSLGEYPTLVNLYAPHMRLLGLKWYNRPL
jgi:hypothetical protein